MQTDQVERDVALRLKEAGFKLMSGDFDFSISNFEKFLDVFFPGFFFFLSSCTVILFLFLSLGLLNKFTSVNGGISIIAIP